MSNALQHGRPGRPVTVTIAQSADTLTIAVRNESDRLHTIRPERLFDRFYRADAARSDSRQNHGLGLAIVKAIATMHGGSVFAQVQADAIRIGMTLPVSEPAQAAPAPARPLPRPAAA
ncbi:Bacteriophytochrome [compost metagenome]